MKSISLLVGLLCCALSIVTPSAGPAVSVAIELHDGDDLVAAIDVAPAGARFHLGPGQYVLSSRVQLKPGMSIEGSEIRQYDGQGVPMAIGFGQYAEPGTETIIVGGHLPALSQIRTGCLGTTDSINLPIPVIGLAPGISMSALTVETGANLAIGELASADESLSAEITNTVIHSTARGMTFSNSGCAMSQARSTLVFTHNVVHGAGATGLLLSNLLTGTSASEGEGPELDAMVAFNRFDQNGNALTLFAGDRGADNALLLVQSIGNVFGGNRSNIFAIGGLGSSKLPTIGNRLDLRSRNDVFGFSTSASPLVPAIALRAGRRVGTSAEPISNQLDADFLNATFVRDSATTSDELSIAGSDFGSGDGNVATVLIRQARVVTSSGLPTAGVLTVFDQAVPSLVPSYVRFTGSRRAFSETNEGLPTPPQSFFEK